jgi:phage/plasmid-associated DNA primase
MAIWRRLMVISFRQAFTGRNRDSRLREKLKAELSGILAWRLKVLPTSYVVRAVD